MFNTSRPGGGYMCQCRPFGPVSLSEPGVGSCDRPGNIAQIRSKLSICRPMWPWNLVDGLKTIGSVFHAPGSYVYRFIAICIFKFELPSENAQIRAKSSVFHAMCPWFWQMTLKNNRTLLLWYLKLCASFQSHLWIQTGVTVRKRSIWVKIDIFCPVWPWNSADDLEK